MRNLELWGGHECTVNRVGDRFFDQTVRSGHQDRLSDLDLFADLGVSALRYPVLWERTAPDRPDVLDWSWADERLGRLRELDVRPIVGLVHHGSGPRYTNLLDDGFAPGLARFAGAVAERYPWVRDWTPVNEPLTTARFSALYGHWYPHKADERSFWTALLNEIDAVRLSMREIRRFNPDARLVQTEDLGRTYATRPLAYQAEFDNARRWMSWDLLSGMVVPGHAMWERLEGFGLGDRLRAIADDPCPPDVIGVNHYLTSDRFLDHRVEGYPPHTRGSNGHMSYADVEAVRVMHPGPDGLEGALQEAWSRYQRPLAITECHNGCTREEQMRWIQEAWDTASALRRRGVEVEAVTAWSLLGAFDWNSLLTRWDGHYENGVFDLRGGEPRATAVVGLLQRLSGGRRAAHPAIAGEGWWRRDVRFEHQPVFRSVAAPEPRRERRSFPAAPRPVLIVGATGTLGKAFARACDWRALDFVLTSRAQLSLDDPAAIERALRLYEPWAVVNAAGWVRVDEAERAPEACRRANVDGAVALAEVCAEKDLPLVSFSSDLVFDGGLARPLLESDAPAPLNAYGRSKAEMEARLLALGGRNLIVRTAAFFSPFDPHNFAAQVARSLARGEEMAAASDLVVSPTYVPDLVEATLDLLIDGDLGLRHLTNSGAVSWYDFGVAVAEALGLEAGRLCPAPAQTLGWAAARPAFVPLASERGALLPDFDHALGRYAQTLRAYGVPAVEAEDGPRVAAA
jgi:dTDP-4-dehydrorhamnose reductase